MEVSGVYLLSVCVRVCLGEGMLHECLYVYMKLRG